MTQQPDDYKDFFISYNHADEQWATWIAWVLEEADYSTVIQAWDFRPGTNFVLEMNKAVQNSERTIAVVSPEFLASTFTAPEWSAAFANDPTGAASKLVPVRVAPADTNGLLGQVVRIDLVGKSLEDAKAALLAGLVVGRAKPLTPPSFPGTSAETIEPAMPTAPRLAEKVLPPANDWQPLEKDLAVRWAKLADRQGSGYAVIEIQLVPLIPARIEVRKLAQLQDELIDAARSSGLITTDIGVQRDATGQLVSMRVIPSRDADVGLVVTREGQRGGWFMLPHDSMGSVLDPADAQPRVSSLLTLLIGLSAPLAERYAIGIGVAPTTMLMVGNADVVGRRTSASFSFVSRDKVVIEPDDSISQQAVASRPDEVAGELLARLVAELGSRQ